MSAWLTGSPIEMFFDVVGFVVVVMLAAAETRDSWRA